MAPGTPLSVAQALAVAQARGLDRLDAQMLLLHASGRAAHDRAWVLAHAQDTLPADHAHAYAALVERRAGGEPLAYITGQREFFGMDLRVSPQVLIPRPDTETLVEWALELLAGRAGATVADLGTGSGAIALALKRERPDLQVHAVDSSAGALDVARANAARLGLEVEFHRGSWCEALPLAMDLIVSNPPYIEPDDPHLPALQHEPLSALVSADEGMRDLRAIVAQSLEKLNPGGWLLLEHGYDQAARVRQLFLDAGWLQAQSRRDLAGIERCSGARAG